MKKLFLFLIVSSLFSSSINAQFLPVTDVGTGVPLTSKHLDQFTETSPYLYNETFRGSVILANKKVMDNLDLLYDIKADIPMFINNSGSFLKFNEIPLEFYFTIPGKGVHVYKRGYPVVAGNYNEESFYEVLVSGKTQLLKKIKKGITESIQYGSASEVKKAVFAEFYFIFDGTTMKRVKKDVKSLMTVLADPSLLTYYKTAKNTLGPTETAMIAIVEKYNTISNN